MIRRFILLACLCVSVFGCGYVRASEYERDMGDLARQLQAERATRAAIIADFDNKIRDKNQTLSVLTERYMAVQKEREDLQIWRTGFNVELEALAKDVAELKLVLTRNLENTKSFPATQLLMKVIDMEYRLNELRKRQGDQGE